MSIAQPLADVLKRHLNVNAFTRDWPRGLQRELAPPASADTARAFQQQLRDAIVNNGITPDEYERLTGEDFDSQEELNAWLRKVWQSLYPETPIELR